MGEEHTTLTSTDGEPTSGYWYTRGAREIEPVDVLNLLRRYRGYSPLSVEPLLVGDPAASACLPDAGA